jgi:cyclophilin family peptidyl-prolyl cis-trans isomerase
VQKQGYVDPATKEVRRIPFEIMVTGDKEPVYEENLEDNGRFNEQPVLPFNAFGSLALARSEFETNSGSSQIFWLLKASPHNERAKALYRRTSISGTTFSGEKCLSGTNFHAICIDFSMLFDNL